MEADSYQTIWLAFKLRTLNLERSLLHSDKFKSTVKVILSGTEEKHRWPLTIVDLRRHINRSFPHKPSLLTSARTTILLLQCRKSLKDCW